MTTNNSQQRFIAIASAIIVILLGASIFLLVSNINKGKTIEQKTEALNANMDLSDSLTIIVDQAMVDLDDMKGTNAELNDIIEQQKMELSDQKDKISYLLKNKKDLSKARAEIQKLTDTVQGYLAEVNQLKSENADLTDANATLSNDLSSQRVQNDELSTAKAALVSEKQALETERADLSEKVNFASVVKVNNVAATGFKKRESGKLAEKRYAKNVDMVKFCFDMTANKLTPTGVERYHVRVINPVGETVAQEQHTLINKETGSEILYTEIIEESYDKEAKNVCFEWVDPNGFQKGNYEVEFYNKGFLAGKSSFRLK